MSIRIRLMLVFLAAAHTAFATKTITVLGPTDTAGNPCSIFAPDFCVKGGIDYTTFSLSLTMPDNPGAPWLLTLVMNYPALIPTPGSVIPPAVFPADGQLYSTSDVLINWNGTNYGIVLSQHIQKGNPYDSYQAGNLYQAPNTAFPLVYSGDVNSNHFQAPGVMPFSPRPDQPVWLTAGGTLLGAGNISIVDGGNVITGQYTVTDQFFAPVGFLSTGSFTILASNGVCANGTIFGAESFVPEPGTFLMILLPVLLFGRYLAARSGRFHAPVFWARFRNPSAV